MNVSIAQKKSSCKFCLYVASNLYKIIFNTYREECKNCNVKLVDFFKFEILTYFLALDFLKRLLNVKKYFIFDD